MRVAVSGASGLIGRETVNLLSNLGYQVLALSRNKKLLDSFFNDSITKIKTNYTFTDLSKIFIGVDAIIHLAAERQRETIQDLSTFIDGNLILTERMLKAAMINRIKVFCFASTIAVYSEKNQPPYTEDQVLSPRTAYGISKLAGEFLVNAYQDRIGCRAINLRFSKVFGSDDQSEKSYFLNNFITQASNKKTLTIWGTGETKRDLIYVKDVASALCRCLAEDDLYGTYNLGSGKAYSIIDIAQLVNEVFGNSGNIFFDYSKPADKRSLCLDSTLVEKRIGWRPNWSLRLALEDIHNMFCRESIE